MQPNMAEVVSFGPFCLSPSQRLLTKDGEPVKIGGRAFDLLSVLVESAGSVVSQKELLERAWPRIFVEDVSLRVRIADLRKVLEQDGQRYLANIPGRGYSFVCQVSRESVETHDQSRGGIAPTAGGNLPAPLTRLFGRSDVIADLHRRLAEVRLVTIVGPGGVGKTSVATAAAYAAAPGHAWFADLATVSDPSLVRIEVLGAFGLAASPDNMLPALSHRLAGQKALLVLDNCEHLVHACASIAEALLGGVSGLQILATSREALRAGDEWVVRLPALETPDSDMSLESASACSAVQLFVQRAAASDDHFVFDERTLASVIDICRRLDGMPLALELAAAAVGVFGVRAVAQRLREQLELPLRGRRTAAARQATLRATLEWSYHLLLPQEQRALRRLAVFQGAFALRSADNIAGSSRPGEPSMVEVLAELAEKSLLSVDLSRDEARYRLLQTTRVYALELLTPRELAAARARHAREMRRLAEAADLTWGMGDSGHARRDSSDLIDDLGAAIEWALSPSGDFNTAVDLIVAATPLRRRLALGRDHAKQVEKALDRVRALTPPNPDAEMHLLGCYGLTQDHGTANPEWLIAAADRLQVLAEELGDAEHLILGLWSRWTFARDLATQNRYAMEMAAAATPTTPETYRALALLTQCTMLRRDGNLTRARHAAETGLTLLARAPGHLRVVPVGLDPGVIFYGQLVETLWAQGLSGQAFEAARTCLDQFRQLGHADSLVYVLTDVAATTALLVGEFNAASEFLEESQSLHQERGEQDYYARSHEFMQAVLRVARTGFADHAAAEHVTPGNWNYRLLRPILPVRLAEAVGRSQSPEAGLAGLEMIAAYVSGSNDWTWPELTRARASLMRLAGAPTPEVEPMLRRALDRAGEMGALTFELRTATTLAELLSGEGRGEEALALLSDIIGRMPEGHDIPDYRRAAALTEALRQSHRSLPSESR